MSIADASRLALGLTAQGMRTSPQSLKRLGLAASTAIGALLLGACAGNPSSASDSAEGVRSNPPAQAARSDGDQETRVRGDPQDGDGEETVQAGEVSGLDDLPEMRAVQQVAFAPGLSASRLRNAFDGSINFHRHNFSFQELPCFTKQGAVVDCQAILGEGVGGTVLTVSGTVGFHPVPEQVRLMSGRGSEQYMALLQAYLLSPEGEVLWTQQGFPKGGSWLERSGGKREIRVGQPLPRRAPWQSAHCGSRWGPASD